MISAARASLPAATFMRTTRTNAISLLPLESACDDGIRDRADAVDLDRDLVSRPQPDRRLAEGADAGRRAGDDQVARHERDRLRDECHDLGDAEDLVRRVRVLHRLAVQD